LFFFFFFFFFLSGVKLHISLSPRKILHQGLKTSKLSNSSGFACSSFRLRFRFNHALYSF
jgi:hypothetical protein